MTGRGSDIMNRYGVQNGLSADEMMNCDHRMFHMNNLNTDYHGAYMMRR